MIELGKIYCEDCLETMRRMPDKSVDLIVTDPPYGLDKRLSSGGGQHADSRFRLAYVNESWDVRMSAEHLAEIFRASKGQVICGGNYYSLPPTRGIVCWDKEQMLPTFSRWEFIWTSFDFPAKLWVYRSGDEGAKHPTQKPIRLISRIVSEFSDDGAIVYDPFMGSGTTAVACERLGRKWIGSEINPDYVKIAEKRIANERAQTKMEFM